MASASRKLRRRNQTKATGMLPELTDKMGEVLKVGQQLAQVSGQIGEVNGKLVDLDNLLLNINETRNLVTQSLEEGRAIHQEQARQRYANLKMFEFLFDHHRPEALAAEHVAEWEQKFRDEFDETLRNTEETPSEEPA